jgi:hypothetical protein
LGSYHFHMTQVKRSAGQSVVAAAAYDGSGNISLDDLASRRDVNDPCFRRIVRAIAIARFGPDGEQASSSGKQKGAIAHEL